MDCLIARKVLFSKEITSPSNGEVMLARQHAAACRQCKQLLQQEENFQRIIKSKLPAQPVPNRLRERTLSTLASERERQSQPRIRRFFQRRSVLLGTAALVLILSVAFFLDSIFRNQRAELNPVVNTLIQDHISSKLRTHPFDVQSSDRGELERWFATRVDFAVNIPQLEDATLVGGRLCLVAGKRVASLTFEKDNVPITMYILDREVLNVSSLKAIDVSKNRRIYHGDAKGCNLILWEERGLVYGLVSDLHERELLELAAKS